MPLGYVYMRNMHAAFFAEKEGLFVHIPNIRIFGVGLYVARFDWMGKCESLCV